MDQTTPVINSVKVIEYKKIAIDASNGKRYFADLSSFSNVYCFPQNEKEWEQVYLDSYGTALIWKSRFEVHVDQIIGLAYQTENSLDSA